MNVFNERCGVRIKSVVGGEWQEWSLLSLHEWSGCEYLLTSKFHLELIVAEHGYPRGREQKVLWKCTQWHS